MDIIYDCSSMFCKNCNHFVSVYYYSDKFTCVCCCNNCFKVITTSVYGYIRDDEDEVNFVEEEIDTFCVESHLSLVSMTNEVHCGYKNISRELNDLLNSMDLNTRIIIKNCKKFIRNVVFFQEILNRLSYKNCSIYSIDENIDSLVDTEKFFEKIYEAQIEYENELDNEFENDEIDCYFGYNRTVDNNNNSILFENPKEQQIISEIREYRQKTKKPYICLIGDLKNIYPDYFWSVGTISKILSNKMHKRYKILKSGNFSCDMLESLEETKNKKLRLI